MAEDHDIIVSYLLGRVRGRRRAEIQKRLFEEEGFFEQTAAVEADLIDAYARGELTPEERRDMERTLLSAPAVQQRIEFARALAHLPASAPKVRARGGYRPAAWGIAAALLIALAGAWMAVRRPAAESARLAAPASTSAAPALFSVLLSPGTVRGSAAIPEIRIPAGANTVELQLDLEGDAHPWYSVTLRTTGGAEVAEQSPVTPRRMPDGLVAAVRIPANLLKSGSYELALEGVAANGQREMAGFYYFRVR
jgi:hypothetical protein